MATFCAENMGNALENIEIVRKMMKRKLTALHVALDERESDLEHELNQIKSNISSALSQWKKRMEDVQHTISHANYEIRDNDWSARLDSEAKEELEILKNSKPKFMIEFSISEDIEEIISSLGEVHSTEIKERERNLKRVLSLPLTNTCTIPIKPNRERIPLQLSDSFENRNQLFRADKDFTSPFDSRGVQSKPYYPEQIAYRPHTFMVKSLSCTDIFNANDIGKQSCPQRAFDDSFISEGKNIKEIRKSTMPIKGVKELNDRKTKSKDCKKLKFSLSSRKRTKTEHSIITAVYKLSELKIKKYLAHDVIVTSRWDKTKEVEGVLRCVVPGEEKVPVVGVELKTNDGNSNGMYLGVSYFKTENHKAYFLRADKVKIQV